MSELPKIFVIILNYNKGNRVTRMLLDIFKNDYPNKEIILVDNDSRDGSFEEAKRNFSKAIFIKNSKNIGNSLGNNVGIEYALERGAKYILLLDCGIQIEKKFLFPLVSLMEENEKIGAMSPIIFQKDETKIWFSGGKIDWIGMGAIYEKKDLARNNFQTDFITGKGMLIRAEIFRKIGLFQDDYFYDWGDIDFSLKIKKAGYMLGVCLESRVFFVEKQNEKEENKNYQSFLSKLIFFNKNNIFFIRKWIFFRMLFLRMKIFIDSKRGNNQETLIIQKALRDFSYWKNK